MTQKDKERHCNICNSDYHTTEGHTDNRMFGEDTVKNELLDKVRKILILYKANYKTTQDLLWFFDRELNKSKEKNNDN